MIIERKIYIEFLIRSEIVRKIRKKDE